MLRLQNGLYIQRHAPMLRVAIPYGILASRQLRTLAHIARKWDRGYGHFSTRQNIQFNWPKLEDVPEILAELATVQMHAIQTSGNCIRNTTTDHFAGIAPDELVNPLVWCEIIRQWSTLHPEFAFLPRKFKIAVSGAVQDRAAVGVHDIGLQAVERDGKLGFRVWIGGGMGRTPIVGKLINPFVEWQDLLTYLQAALRVYNPHGRRDNKYKARIKILVKDLTPEVYAQQVDEEWQTIKGGPTPSARPSSTRSPAASSGRNMIRRPGRARSFGRAGRRRQALRALAAHQRARAQGARLRRRHRLAQGHRRAARRHHRRPDGRGRRAGRRAWLRRTARLARAEPDPGRRARAPARTLAAAGSAEPGHPNVGLLTNIIACPGGDFCALANAVSIPVAEAIQRQFDDLTTCSRSASWT